MHQLEFKVKNETYILRDPLALAQEHGLSFVSGIGGAFFSADTIYTNYNLLFSKLLSQPKTPRSNLEMEKLWALHQNLLSAVD